MTSRYSDHFRDPAPFRSEKRTKDQQDQAWNLLMDQITMMERWLDQNEHRLDMPHTVQREQDGGR